MPTVADRQRFRRSTTRELGSRLLRLELRRRAHRPARRRPLPRAGRPPWSPRDVRAEVVARPRARRPAASRSTLRPNAAWRGFRAGQYVERRRRDRRRAPHALLLARLLAQHAPAALELTVTAHPRGSSRSYLASTPRPGMVVGLSPGRGRLRPAGRAARAPVLISGGSGITPVMSMLRTLCDEGHAGEVTFLHYAPRAASARSTRRARARWPRATRRARRAAYTREPGAGDLDGYFSREHLAAVDPDCAERRGLRLRPARADRRRPRASGPTTAWPSACTSRASARRRCAIATGDGRRAASASRAAASSAANDGRTAARAGRGRRPHARVRLPHGHLPHLHLPQGLRAPSATSHRRGSDAEDEDDPALRLRACRRRRRRPLTGAHEHHRHRTPRPTDHDARPQPARHASPPSSSTRSARELDAIRERVLADLGERDADLHPQGDPGPARRSRSPAAALLFARLPPAGLARRHRRALAVEDPRQHGDRPQRHARPVRLDAATRRSRQGVRVGHRLPRRPVAPLAQLHAPHVHQHPRQGPRHRLRHAAHVRGPAVAPVLPRQPGLRHAAGDLLPVRRRAARPRDRADRGRRDDAGRRSAACSTDDLAQGPPPVAQGLRRCSRCSPARRLPLTLAGNATANLARNLWSFTIIFCGHFPDGVARVHRGGDRGRDPRRAGTSASSSARPTSPAASCSTSCRATSATRSSTTCSPTSRRTATPRSRVEVREICERYGLPYNSGPLHKQFGSVVAQDLPPRAPGGGGRRTRRRQARNGSRSGSPSLCS